MGAGQVALSGSTLPLIITRNKSEVPHAHAPCSDNRDGREMSGASITLT
jgi:hypothetical protein